MRLSKTILVSTLLLAISITISACGPSGGGTTAKPTTQAASETEKPVTTSAPATTAVNATTALPTTEESETQSDKKTVVPVDYLSSYWSISESRGWYDTIFTLGEGNTGRQYVKFSVTPMVEGIDGGVHFADFDKDVAKLEDLSIMIRMAGGYFEARNGEKFEKLSDVPVVTNTAYVVELMADMDAKTYTVYVTPAEGAKILLAENYAFNATANEADDLGKIYFVTSGTNDELKAESLVRMAIYTEGKEYWSYGENYGWQQHPIYLGRAFTGIVKIEFDMFTNVMPVGGSVSFADIDKDLYGFGDLFALCRMNYTFFDARNGDAFETIGNVPIAIDTVYHCEILADMDAKTQSMWVTPPGGERTLIAENYAFRTTANDSDDVGKVYVISAHASNQICMKNLKIEDASGSN